MLCFHTGRRDRRPGVDLTAERSYSKKEIEGLRLLGSNRPSGILFSDKEAVCDKAST